MPTVVSMDRKKTKEISLIILFKIPLHRNILSYTVGLCFVMNLSHDYNFCEFSRYLAFLAVVWQGRLYHHFSQVSTIL